MRAAFSYFEKRGTPFAFCGMIQIVRKKNKTGKGAEQYAELEKNME